MKNRIKIYNLIFPIWLLWLLPITWVVVLPANFLIDLLVLVLTMILLKVKEIYKISKAVILKVWLFGFLADFIGTTAMLMALLIDFDPSTKIGQWWQGNISTPVSYYPFESIYAVIYVAVCVAISAFFIYLFNFKICFKKSNLSEKNIRKLSLSLATFTAPYFFFFPATWFY